MTQVLNALPLPSMPEEWDDPAYRQATMEATNENLIAWGIRLNREGRGLTRAQLAERMGTRKSTASKLEDSGRNDFLVSTLSKTAHALDMALLIKFVDYAEFEAQTRDVRTDRLLACSYVQSKALSSHSRGGRAGLHPAPSD